MGEIVEFSHLAGDQPFEIGHVIGVIGNCAEIAAQHILQEAVVEMPVPVDLTAADREVAVRMRLAEGMQETIRITPLHIRIGQAIALIRMDGVGTQLDGCGHLFP